MNPDLERIAVVVQACPAVAGLHPGQRTSIATTLPQGYLLGVALDGADLTIGVVGRFPARVADIAAQVRAAAAEHAPGYRIVVSVEDMHVPDDDQSGPTIIRATGPGIVESAAPPDPDPDSDSDSNSDHPARDPGPWPS